MTQVQTLVTGCVIGWHGNTDHSVKLYKVVVSTWDDPNSPAFARTLAKSLPASNLLAAENIVTIKRNPTMSLLRTATHCLNLGSAQCRCPVFHTFFQRLGKSGQDDLCVCSGTKRLYLRHLLRALSSWRVWSRCVRFHPDWGSPRYRGSPRFR